VPELALDHDGRDAFAGHLGGVGVAGLVWREAAPRSCRGGGAPQLGASRAGFQWRPRVVPLMTHSSGPTGSSRRRSSQG
jgi:hypothetical protein